MKPEKAPWNHNYAYNRWVSAKVGHQKRILDVGCGDGTLALYLRSSDNDILGIDSSASSIQKANTKNVYDNAAFIQTPFEDFQANGKRFDAVFSSLPHFRDKGRDGQRSLAMVFSAGGYLLGTLTAFLTGAPDELKILYLEYLLCGIAMLVLNKVFQLKASGHACGIVGPVLLMLYFKMILPAVVGMVLILPVYVSSLKTKRHTAPQLLGGSLIPLVSLGVIHLLYFLIV